MLQLPFWRMRMAAALVSMLWHCSFMQTGAHDRHARSLLHNAGISAIFLAFRMQALPLAMQPSETTASWAAVLSQVCQLANALCAGVRKHQRKLPPLLCRLATL